MSDDLASGYLDHRTRLASVTAGEELLSRFARPAKAAKPGEGGPAAPATSPVQGDEQQTPPQGSLAGRIGRDLGIGAVETPRAIVGGVRDAIQSTIDLGDDLGTWLEEVGNLPGIKIGKDGVSIVSGTDLANLPRLGSGKLALPDVKDPESVTGGIVKGIAQFLTGMKGAGKVLGGVKASYAKTAAQGALANFAAFDPHQQRLSNLVERFPALGNPVTAYLASDPNDSDAEGRFKNAIEGLGLGFLADGFVKGVRLLRQARLTRMAAMPPTLETQPAGVGANAFRELGDDTAEVGSKLVTKRPPQAMFGGDDAFVTPSGVKRAAEEGTTEGGLYINFARIDTGDDVARVMREVAEQRRSAIEGSARGKQTFKEIELNAQQQDAWDVLTSRRVGEPLNAEQSLAARQLWVSTTEKLTQMAELASASPSEANLFAFRKMLAIQDAVQQQVIAARTETARALASWRIPAGGSQERLRDVVGVLEQNGGTEVSRELAQRIATLGRAGMVKEMAAVVEKSAYAKTRDAVVEAWINGLLSSPKTHVVNTTSNSAVMFLRMGERRVAEGIRKVLGDDGGVAAGEAVAQWHGLTSGIKDAFRYAYKAAKTGESGFGIGKVEMPRQGAITSEALGLSQSGWLGRGADFVGQGIRVPGRALAAEDEFFKTLGYRMELHAQALRMAADDVAAGRIAQDGFKNRIADLISNPPENIRMAAVDAANYQTFTNAPGKLGSTLSRLTSKFPATKVILPFVRTPANILRFTFERTPLAPLMSKFRADIAAGGARQQLALAQMGMGTMTMLAMADFTMNGQITGRGPKDKGARDAMLRSGWKPYSVKAGDKWVTYNRLDPVGSLIGMAADATEMLMHAQEEALDDADTEKLAVAITAAFAGNIVNKTYLSGISGFVDALNDPTRHAESFVQRLTGSVVPAAVAQGARTADPYVREVESMMDAIRARTPGLSDNLPPRRDLWGRPISTESGVGKAFDAFAPVVAGDASKQEPIDKEILRQDMNVPMPSRRTSFDGVTIDLGKYPGAYSRYLELAGNEIKHPAWDMGAKDLMNAVVSGEHPLSAVYELRTDGPDGGKEVFILEKLADYRQRARDQLLDEFPDIRREVTEKQEAARALRFPATE